MLKSLKQCKEDRFMVILIMRYIIKERDFMEGLMDGFWGIS